MGAPEYVALAIAIGIVVVIVILAVGGWLLNAWRINVLRNNLAAKRRLRREGQSNRPEDQGSN
jgi:hypothetical protein